MNFLEKLQNNYKIILASSSPRRQHLLKSICMEFEIISPDINEKQFEQSNPENYCQNIATIKAKAVSNKLNSAPYPTIIIAADTIVVKDNNIINKPADKNDAINTLKMLSNNKHKVYTGVAILNTATQKIKCDFSCTNVSFRHLSEDEILEYVNSEKPMDKAGSYGIQDDYGALFVNKIDGCFYNVVGLPLELVFRMIKEITE
jgi:septum formation protein